MNDRVTDTKQLKTDMWKRMADSPFLMVGPADGSTHSEPLTAQLDEEQVDTLFFFVAKDNRLVQKRDLAIQFVSRKHDLFASLHGIGRVDGDLRQIDRLWNKQAEAWFPGGKDDPDLALLRVDIESAELWETDISIAGRLKMLFGGKMKSGDQGSHATVRTTAEGSAE